MSSNMRIPKVCEYCGNTFIAQKLVTRFCSLKCGQRNYKKEKREEKLDAENSKYANSLQNKPIKSVEAVSTSKLYLTVKDTCKLLNSSDSTMYVVKLKWTFC